MIIGPCIGYIMQTMTMVQTNQADGFSTFVSFILIVANLIRIFWWYSERFSLVILVASIVMIICQLVLIYMWVKIQNNPRRNPGKQNIQLFSTQTHLDGSAPKPFTESFWVWRSFSSYTKTLTVIAIVLLVLTTFGNSHIWFNVLLGTLSSGVEVRKLK